VKCVATGSSSMQTVSIFTTQQSKDMTASYFPTTSN